VHVTHDQEEAMTMADTIAVMNEGKIEQMGSPADLYESPSTAFVANFLGQSNLIRGKIESSDGDSSVVLVHDQKISLLKSRNRSEGASVLVGIRPEKIRIGLPEDRVTGNSLTGGIVSDVSFVGVSTQYVVEMPWKQDLMVFEQNDGGTPTLRPGDPVSLSWNEPFTFGLDGSEDVNAGAEVDDGA